jgi:hypothetical protein
MAKAQAEQASGQVSPPADLDYDIPHTTQRLELRGERIALIVSGEGVEAEIDLTFDGARAIAADITSKTGGL